jgi:hypothetical protein
MFSQAHGARAHAIKSKTIYCLITSWGTTTTTARSPTSAATTPMPKPTTDPIFHPKS